MRIIGQPINMRDVSKIRLESESGVNNDDWERISRIAVFGLKHGYLVAV